MESSLSAEEWTILERWMAQTDFINWARNQDAADVAYWEAYFNQHPDHWKIGKIGRQILVGIPAKRQLPAPGAKKAALDTLLKHLNERGVAKSSPKKFQITRKILMVAASVAIIVCASAIVYQQFFFNPTISFETAFGEQKEVELPDGSMCIINANSKLQYQKQQPRKVWLEGEAFFTVKKVPSTKEKFQVITTDLDVVVFGTAFNVNTRNDKTQVFLEEGKVTLGLNSDENQHYEMLPGELVIYTADKNELSIHKQNSSSLQAASWKEGTLIFKEKLLLEALFEIEDIYGIQFIVETDALHDETITGGVPIKNLEVTLSTLTEVYGLQMDAVGKRYFISGRE